LIIEFIRRRRCRCRFLVVETLISNMAVHLFDQYNLMSLIFAISPSDKIGVRAITRYLVIWHDPHDLFLIETESGRARLT